MNWNSSAIFKFLLLKLKLYLLSMKIVIQRHLLIIL